MKYRLWNTIFFNKILWNIESKYLKIFIFSEKEEEELALALAISQSEAEAKEMERQVFFKEILKIFCGCFN